MLHRGRAAGTLTEHDDGGYTFRYDDAWLADEHMPPVSLTMPKTRTSYYAPALFPAFFQLLPEGFNKRVLCQIHRLDASDEFSILLHVAGEDTVGALTVQALDRE